MAKSIFASLKVGEELVQIYVTYKYPIPQVYEQKIFFLVNIHLLFYFFGLEQFLMDRI